MISERLGAMPQDDAQVLEEGFLAGRLDVGWVAPRELGDSLGQGRRDLDFGGFYMS